MPRPIALLSVSDKTGLVELALGLIAGGFEIVSTGGTARALTDAGVPITPISSITGFPEIMDGRVKTLHPTVHGGILARRGTDDAIAAEHGIRWIDVVVVNLYPFESTAARGADDAEVIEQIDVGGPAMVRAAAKNHERVTVVVDPADYSAVLGDRGPELRRRLSAKAFRHTANYDAIVANWLGRAEDGWPTEMALPLELVQSLRYGENPHQRAAFYAAAGEGGRSLARAKQLQGKELSFNNLGDLDAAVRIAFEFDAPAAVIVKHMNPCGAAIHPSGVREAYALALSADPVSAYGGILAVNRPLDEADAIAIVESRVFFEVVVAPGLDAGARETLAKRPNLRVLDLPADWQRSQPAGWDARRVHGGWLLQSWDIGHATEWEEKLRPPTSEEIRALSFAWIVCRNVKSNAIALARIEGDGIVLNGIGAGQMSRVDSVRIAIQKAARPVAGSVLASDAFFPFADGVNLALAAGVTAIVQPGGSIRDDEVLDAARAAGIAMTFSRARHFRH